MHHSSTDSLIAQDSMHPTPQPSIAAADPTGEKVLCPHCQRTATNGIKCKGICVADSDY